MDDSKVECVLITGTRFGPNGWEYDIVDTLWVHDPAPPALFLPVPPKRTNAFDPPTLGEQLTLSKREFRRVVYDPRPRYWIYIERGME